MVRLFWLPLARFIALVGLTVLGPVRSRGSYRIPRSSGALILANHISDCDPVAVQYSCPRAIHFMAKSELFSMRFVGWALRLMRAFPVKRGEPDRGALRLAAELIKMGELVCVFPEGELSESGELEEVKPGVALIARMAGAPIICCGLRGTQRIVPYGSTIPRPGLHWVDIQWGEPRSFSKEATIDEILAWVRGQLLELTDAEDG